MSQPPSSPYPGSYPPPQQPPGGYQPPQQPQYGGGYPQAPQQPGGYPEAGQPGFGAPAGPPPKKKSNVGKILLIILAVVVVLCVGGGVALYALGKDAVNEVVDATKTRLVEPETLGGRPQLTMPELQPAVEQMKTSFKDNVPGATSVVSGIYGDPAKQDMVLMAGATVLQADPTKNLNDFTKGMGTALGVKEFKTIDAGPLGGEAKCGDGDASGIPVGVCAWADRGSVGTVVIYFKSAADLQPQFAALRAEIEKKN